MEISKICEHMAVIGSDGRRVGFVVRLEGADGLKLSRIKNGHGFEHVIPLAWVSDVDRYVFLNKGSRYVRANWEAPLDPHHRARAA
jgi:hypothetical protein